MPLQAFQLLEKRFEKQIRLFELKRGKLEKSIEARLRRFEERNRVRLDDEVRFIRSWIEKPWSIGAVTPSSKVLARAMASYVDPLGGGPVIELGPGTGPVTEALVAQGIAPERLILVEADPTFCRLLRQRYPAATVVQGDAYSLKRLLSGRLDEPAAAVVSGLPLITKPLKVRLKLLFEAFALMLPGAPFVQFTYAAMPPIPKALHQVRSEASERIWMNIPPARIWVYRKD
jgi:phosphatidylethanolamine/phosphatidyl-N-methylethanolamine N-methyltransferase